MNRDTFRIHAEQSVAWLLALAMVLVAVAPGFAKGPAAPSALATIEIQRVDLRTTESGTELTVQGNGPLVWTQYRDDSGDLVVELPNTVLAGEVLPPAPRGLVSSVVLEPESSGVRPMTRLVVSTNADASHTLFVNDGLLTLSFAMVSMVAQSNAPTAGGQKGQIVPALEDPATADDGPSSEVATPEFEDSIAVAAAPTVPTATMSAGTPQEPVVGPVPTGARATRLLGVEVVDLDGALALRILGDGSFLYTTFRLENPPRFVIDLRGVVNSSRESRLQVDRAPVGLVRVAQFRPYPDPVSRVVLDLAGDAIPLLEPSGDGLWVRFANPQVLVTDAGDTASQSFDQQADAAGDDVAQAGSDELVLAEATTGAPDSVPAMPSVSPMQATSMSDEPATEEPMVGDLVASAPLEVEADMEEIPETTSSLDTSDSEILTQSDDVTEGFEAGQEAVEPAYSEPAYSEPTYSEPTYSGSQHMEGEAEIASEPLFADEGNEEPLQIVDETRLEAPTAPMNDVALFEAQEANIPTTNVQRNETPGGFAVQRIDTSSNWVGDPLTLTVKDADLTEVLRTIARYAELNLVVQPGISAPVTVEFIAVPWDQALDAILKINRLGQQLEGNILRIAQKDLFRQEAVEDLELAQARALSVPLSTVIKRLSYAEAQDVSRILTRGQSAQGGGQSARFGTQQTGILSRRGSVNVDQRTNTLIIKELPSYLDTVIQVIENLDIPEKQVMIEARIVETTRNFSRSLGVDWSLGGTATAAGGNTTGLQFPNRVEAGGGVQLLTGGDNGFFNLSLGNILNTFQIDLALQAAEAEGLVNVISSPKIATLNNHRAEIETGLQLPVQTVVGGGGTVGGGVANPFGTVSVSFIRASLRLEVTPQVTFEGTILMDVNIEKDEPQFALAVAGAPTAPIATRRASTRVRVADGGTAVIGGIYQVSANESESRVPGLARIPVLGQLFKNRNRTNQNQELLIFITPRVIQQ